jgi:phosphoglycolate phosphatase-like HAD superfamily hydrolase
MSKLRIAVFDIDGVLLDSLTPHLKICEDKNKEYDLHLKIPSASEFKTMVRRGTRISPMQYFFMAVGFPEEFAKKANLQYQEDFMRSYAPAPFPGVHQILKALHDSGFQMGIVTSNVKANVVEALGQSIEFFRPDCIYSEDNLDGLSKSGAIVSVMTQLRALPLETIYVGDQPADWEAAKAAGVNFLGVSYGWGISDEDKDFPVAREVPEIYRYIANQNAACS